MSDPFIKSLVDDMSYVKPLSHKALNLQTLGIFIVAAALVTLGMGLRPDLTEFISTSTALFKNGVFFVMFLWGLSMVHKISRPSEPISGLSLAPLALIPLGIILGYVTWPERFSLNAFEDNVAGMFYFGSGCFVTLSAASAISLGILWKAWLSKTASSHPVLLGAVAGFSTSSLMAFSYALHCSKDFALYVTVYYGAAVLLMTAIGALLGRSKLTW